MDWDLKLGGVEEPVGRRRRRRTSSSSFQQPLTCLVDGCTSDLNNCTDYHRRHRVCHRHSKTPVVLVAAQEQRFCQQCSRFQSLIEFDDRKRSCRKRLDGHNRRRRKSQPESIYISPAGSGSRSNEGLLHPPPPSSMIHQLTQPPVTYPAASATPTVWPPPFPAPSHPYMTASSSFGYAQTDVTHIDCALSLLSSGTQHQHQHHVCTSSSSSATNHCYDAFDDQDHHRDPCRMFPFRWD